MKDRIVKIKELFSLGYTPTMVANLVGINRKGIHYYINKYDIKVLNRFRGFHSNDKYFDIIDTEAKAYLLGFFIADGCITDGNRICLSNSIDDESVIELFQSEISPTTKIHYKNYQQGAKIRKTQLSFRFTSNHLYNKLVEKYGITENKTHNNNFKFDFNNIPESLHVHFIRGFFDGDGGVSFYRLKNSIYFNFSFITTSKVFIEQIAEIFSSRFNIKPVIKEVEGKTINWFTLRFSYNRDRVGKIKEIYEK